MSTSRQSVIKASKHTGMLKQSISVVLHLHLKLSSNACARDTVQSVGPEKMQHSRRISGTFVFWNFCLSHSSPKALAHCYFF